MSEKEDLEIDDFYKGFREMAERLKQEDKNDERTDNNR